jgi:hypothetical protein
MNRPDPEPALLTRSREAHRIPDSWDWAWCANADVCGEFVWYDPAVRSVVDASTTAFLVTCSAPCARTVSRRFTHGTTHPC